ncbi:MAG: (Fe-S)-binding protein [Desulfobaccales bacterium]
MLRKPCHSNEAQPASAGHPAKALDTRLNEFLTKCRSGRTPRECLVCQKNCEFLRSTMTPRQLAERLKEDYGFDATIPFSCNLCNLCGELCPEGLDVGGLCQEIRTYLSSQGMSPLPQHKPVISHQRWGSSRVFTLAKANRLNQADTRQVFFPGCNLAAYSPDLVAKTFEHLRSKLPHTGIILNCCGAPSYLLGEMTLFQSILDGIDRQLKALGASEIITACPECYQVLKVHAPQWKIRGLYEVLVEVGLPERDFGTAATIFAIHDSCAVRHEAEFRQSVREVLQKLECRTEEMEFSGERTRCCGGGGMIAAVNPGLAGKIARLRVEETPHDIVTYCAGCRENFARQEKGALHVLDLVFNSNWRQDRTKSPREGLKKWKNRWDLKRRLKRR